MARHHLAPPNDMEIKANGVHPIKAVATNLPPNSQKVIPTVTLLRATVGETTHSAEARDRLLPEMIDQALNRRFPSHRLLRNTNPLPQRVFHLHPLQQGES
jgi:hypothetical protein